MHFITQRSSVPISVVDRLNFVLEGSVGAIHELPHMKRILNAAAHTPRITSSVPVNGPLGKLLDLDIPREQQCLEFFLGGIFERRRLDPDDHSGFAPLDAGDDFVIRCGRGVQFVAVELPTALRRLAR